MKPLSIFLFIATIELTAQENLRYSDDELFFYQDSGSFIYKILPISKAIWDNTGVLRYEDNWGRAIWNPLPVTLDGYIGFVTNSNGMDYILSSEQNDVQVFGNGLYKVSCYSNNYENSYFYLDIRDCNYPTINSEYAYNDFTIKYISSEKKFYIANGKGVSFNSSLFKEVTNKLVALWEVEGIAGPKVNCFDSYWTNCLGITDYYNFPRLIWGPIPDFNATSYRIYRSIGNSNGLSMVNYSLIAQTPTDVFEYVDEEIDLSDNQYVFYYVAAYNSSTNQNSQLTNLVYYKRNRKQMESFAAS